MRPVGSGRPIGVFCLRFFGLIIMACRCWCFVWLLLLGLWTWPAQGQPAPAANVRLTPSRQGAQLLSAPTPTLHLPLMRLFATARNPSRPETRLYPVGLGMPREYSATVLLTRAVAKHQEPLVLRRPL